MDKPGGPAMWNQVYNPFNNSVLSTIAAALPVVTLLVLIASNKVKAHIAAVIGVGGFLGVGQKDVAVPFEALQIQRKQNSSSIDKITVSYTKDQLSNAPKFAYFQVQSNTTTGSAGSTGSPGGMSKPASPTGK